MAEAHNGYPTHIRWALGHLAEAEHETCASWPTVAAGLRALRRRAQAAWFRSRAISKLPIEKWMGIIETIYLSEHAREVEHA
jgi:hypothetical protein